MKLPRRTISASGRGRCRAAGRLAHRAGASLSDAAGAHRRRLCRRRCDRHRRASDRPMAVGAARPAIRHREPAGRRRQYRHRGGRAMRRRMATRSCWSVRPQRDQRDALRQAQLQFHPRHRAGRGHCPRALRHGGQSIIPGQDSSRVHRLCQGQSRQDQYGVGRQRNARAMCPASCSR